MFTQLRQRSSLTGSTDHSSRSRTQQIKTKDFWEIELGDVSTSLFEDLDDLPLDRDEPQSESQTESTTVTMSSSSSAIAATDPVDEAFLDYLEEILDKDSDEMLRLQSEQQFSAPPLVKQEINHPLQKQQRRCSLPRNPRKGKNPNKSVAGGLTILPTTAKPLVVKKRMHRRAQSCDDALLLHLPRVYSALGVC